MSKILRSSLIAITVIALTAGTGAYALASNGNRAEKIQDKMERLKDRFEVKINRLETKAEAQREKLESRFEREMGKLGDWEWKEEWKEEKNHATSTNHVTSTRHLLLVVNPRGLAEIRGFVTGSIGSTTFSVRSWGGIWQVGVASTTKVYSEHETLADFAAGDYVIVKGSVSSTSPLTLTAKSIRDWTP